VATRVASDERCAHLAGRTPQRLDRLASRGCSALAAIFLFETLGSLWSAATRCTDTHHRCAYAIVTVPVGLLIAVILGAAGLWLRPKRTNVGDRDRAT